eukprot:Skav235965  [mRNA]  locus=scaffold592:113694:114665:- [translate_table: standard]
MLSASDPYYVAKEEVAKAMNRLPGRRSEVLSVFEMWLRLGLHQEWKRLLMEDTARSQRFQQMHQEITGELEQLGLDLDDIDAPQQRNFECSTATISLVESNRNTFQLSDAELQSRKRFVKDSRRNLEELQKDLNGGKEIQREKN